MQTQPSPLRHPLWLAILYGIAIWSLTLGWVHREAGLYDYAFYGTQKGLKVFPAAMMAFIILFYGVGMLKSLVDSFLLEKWLKTTFSYRSICWGNWGVVLLVGGNFLYARLVGRLDNATIQPGFWIWCIANGMTLCWLWWRVHRPFRPMLYGDETILDDNPS